MDAGAMRPDAARFVPSPTHDASGSSDAANGQAQEVALIDNSAWTRYDPATDPLRSHQPAQIMCGIAGFYPEYGVLEIDTNVCNYVLAEHPSLVDVPAGTEVHLELSHYDLTAPEPAEVHAAILFNDAVQWETHIPVPSPAAVLDVSWKATQALKAGDPIRVHLHNHGQNTYQLVYLRALLGP